MDPTKAAPLQFKANEKMAFNTNVTTRYEIDCGNGIKVELTAFVGHPFHITAPGGATINLNIIECYSDGVPPSGPAEGDPVH